jgi:hypothetical protein
MARIRTLNFLPNIFQTATNAEFLGATLDQLVNPPSSMKIQGYVGSKIGYGINANDHYVIEPTATRANYQLDPAVVFVAPSTSVNPPSGTATDFITYPGIIDALSLQSGVTGDNSRLFPSQFYSWDSFTDLDKLINYTQYYWLPEGPPYVTVGTSTIYNNENYSVIDLPNGYEIASGTSSVTSINPPINLLRGGSYIFNVNQASQFWIQTQPGVSGYSSTHPNFYLRDVLGVDNNGASNGQVIFNVPLASAQSQYVFPTSIPVGVVSTLPFADVEGQLVNSFAGIDGITSLNGLTVMFYNTGVPNEIGYTSEYLNETPYDTNQDSPNDPYDPNNQVVIPPLTLDINASSSVNNAFTLVSGSTTSLKVNNTVTFSINGNNPVLGGITAGQVYFINSIINSTQFTISKTINGSPVALTTGTGSMAVNVNQGLWEEGIYSTVNQTLYTVTYVGDLSNPIIRLVPTSVIPTNVNIVPTYGTQWINLPFYRDVLGDINIVPYITAPLNTLYYQDGSNPENVGIINIVDTNVNVTIDVDTDILGKKTYTSPNGVVFTNGLLINFNGSVIPANYLQDQYYVQGVGTSIQLVPASTLVCPEAFTQEEYIPFSSTGFDDLNYDGELGIPAIPDYITIARNAISMNAWSRSNRWFHADTINAIANYNNNPSIVTTYATAENRAVRPIIEFYPNLKLFNSGIVGKLPVDYIDMRATDALKTVAGSTNYYPDIQTYSTSQATIAPVTNSTSTTVTIPASAVTGSLTNLMFIADSSGLLPVNSQITNISGTDTLTLTVSWEFPENVAAGSNVSIVASDLDVSDYALFPGARVIFAADNNPNVANKIYVVEFSQIHPYLTPIITLTVAPDGDVLMEEQTVISRGYYNHGLTFFYDPTNINGPWVSGQQKNTVNQAPLFDIFDNNGISLGDQSVYVSTSFRGCKLFAYGIGTGNSDSVLGFPIRYSSINNIGDISFDVSLNSDTFSYVNGTSAVTENVNIGYVYNYSDLTTQVRQLGWQTAIADSVQYQVFSYDYDPLVNTSNSFVCDVSALSEPTTTNPGWPTLKVYVNNIYQDPSTYTYSVGNSATIVNLNTLPSVTTVIQIFVLSDQISQLGYYDVPINLNNNPLNANLTTANMGDIRDQYQDIYINAPGTSGPAFGANNYRDLGDLVPYGTKIIQNSASLVLPGAFLRSPDYDLFGALLYNSREYVTYKQLIVNIVQNYNYTQRYTPSQILDTALQHIISAKSKDQAFFWSDMLPSQTPYISNTYTFNNISSGTFYPLSQIYNYDSANYNGVLVYHLTTVQGVAIEKQLLSGVDYVISTDSPSLEVFITLQAGDQIVIKEYNQTYGSYAPNTPTKLGLYPAFQPAVVLDSDYTIPTWFIKGHDGSYTKLYGEYNETLGVLVDFRDQALFEFEKRVYNNLKLSTQVPISKYEIVPGFFRNSSYSWSDFLSIYTPFFLNWVGQNRLNYKTQFYNTYDQYSYNYTNSAIKLGNTLVQQGYWRGLYEYLYDTTTPNETPWEMLGLPNEPTWWVERYGPAPYTSDNGILWGDLQAGLIWNNGNPYINPEVSRPGLLAIIPVDTNGDLLSPLVAAVGNYDPSTFQKDWAVGDNGPTELSYRRSSTYPFDLMGIYALTRPAEFFNLGVDLDNYKYSEEFNQYLVNNRSHLVLNNIQVYGNGIAKTSYINWMVDFAKQQGIDATADITTILNNLDVRLVYRLAGFSDKTQLQFYVEKGSPNSTNASLLIPNESYSILLYENQPTEKIIFSSVIIQQNDGYWTVFGNSQLFAFFTVANPIFTKGYSNLTIEKLSVNVTNSYSKTQTTIVPYGTKFYSPQEVAQFLMSYGAHLEQQGMVFDQTENAVPVNWKQMVYEFLYWSQTGWSNGSLINLNPAATALTIDPVTSVVQPLTIQNQNFILNQDLYPIDIKYLCVNRDQTAFSAHPLNKGDSLAYGQFNVSNFEHGIVFDNVTLFNDVIYNLVTGLRQNRVYVRGIKSADWNGTVNAGGFIISQNNIQEWTGNLKYTKGEIVSYKNKYWQALDIVQPTQTFDPTYWKQILYSDIQFGMLANPSTRAYESTLYYDVNKANLQEDADLLAFNLIGYRPRDYLALIDLTSPTQIQIYQNMIKNMGTLNAVSAFDGATLATGGISYNTYENWAILSSQFGGILNSNFADFRVNADLMSGDPSIISLTNGIATDGAMQEVPLYGLFNYGTPVSNPDILTTTTAEAASYLYPPAGYVNFNDVEMSSYFYAGLPRAVDINGAIVPIKNFYVGQYVWLANFFNKWNVFAWKSVGQIVQVQNNLNSTATVTFAAPHNLTKLQPLSIINFASNVDGYYIITDVPNIMQVTINLAIIGANQTTVNGYGIGLTFESHRVTNPSDIESLDLTQADFVDNLVWVDSNVDGNWAVLLKSNTYEMQNELEQPASTTFGSAVAFTNNVGYLVGDAGAGNLYRYTYNALSESYNLSQTITNSTSFGSQIVYSEANNIYVVSQPTGTPKVFIYVLNSSPISNNLITYQTISAPGGVTNWGSTMAMSKDSNWLYISDTVNNNVYVYRKESIPLQAGHFVSGQTYIITEVGTTDFTTVGAIYNQVGITFVATGSGTGTGTATQCTYQQASVINGSTYGYVSGDDFSAALSTDQDGSLLIVGAPLKNYSMTIEDWGQVSVFNRTEQNFLAQYTLPAGQAITFPLTWTPVATSAITASATAFGTNLITCSASMTSYPVNTPIVFTGNLSNTNISTNQVYYIASTSTNTITIKTSRNTTTPVNLETASLTGVKVYVQITPLYVSVNGSSVNDSNYATVGNSLVYYGGLNAGDIVNVNDSQFFLAQTFNSNYHDRTGIHFGYSVANSNGGSDILVGSPFEISDVNGQEGAVYKYSNGGAKYGVVIGSGGCNVTAQSTILINGFAVTIPTGNATVVANAINNSGIINVQAASTSDNNIIIQCINNALAQVNQNLVIAATNTSGILSEIGITPYTETQILQCPYTNGPTQFGYTIKVDQFNNIVVSAPSGTRYEGTLFDFVNYIDLNNDTVFDNNATQFVDSFPNAGAVYMFQYMSDYNESLMTPGQYVYAQSVNDNSTSYGNAPMYGFALDFNDNTVVVGTPNYVPGLYNGQVVVYTNPTGTPVWSVYRSSAPVVDINTIQNTQLYSASTNETLVNFDYIDPLQNKILGAARENLDYISSADPAQYNSNLASNNGNMWGATQVGQLWFDTTNVRWVNYHQNDVVYNSKYWGSVFPGSDVAVYSWIASFIPPNQYQGPGVPYNTGLYCINGVLNASNVVVPVYYFWVRNTNTIFTQTNKTLADTSVASYIASPRGSGISFMAPLLPNTFAMYNSLPFFNGTDTAFHIGFSNGNNDDVAHQEFALIREGFSEDFLPGLPPITKHPTVITTIQGNTTTVSSSEPSSLYARMLDSMAGCDQFGAIVPDPFLPAAVQSGIQVRPRQSFFYDRFMAINNYLTYANSILAKYPIAEIRPDATFLFASGEFFTTSDYWNYTYWWADGYNDSTKSLYQVPYYADLATLSVPNNTLITVQQNTNGAAEIYRNDGNGVWTRVGLQNGTIAFDASLWDYADAQIGWDGSFFDTGSYDTYPSQETYYIIRALNEQIFVEDLIQYRNNSLILLFQYIQSETVESQNFLPWLNKTSLLDVQHTLRELLPYENYVTDNFDFLAGYINEVKPYHVLIKDFLYDYSGKEDYTGNITDFDLPAQYNNQYQTFISPEIVYSGADNKYEYLNTNSIWNTEPHTQWYQNYGVSLTGQPDYQLTTLSSYMTTSSSFMIVDNANGFPTNGVVMIDNEQIGYQSVDRALNMIIGLSRGVNDTTITTHTPGAPIIMNLPPVMLMDSASGYTNPPRVTAYIDTSIYPAPTVPAQLEAIMSLDAVIGINVINPGQGYVVMPEIVIDPAQVITFSDTAVNAPLSTIVVYAPNLQTGNAVQYTAGSDNVGLATLQNGQWYYVNVLQTVPTSVIALYTTYSDAINDKNRVPVYSIGSTNTLTLNFGAKAFGISTSYPVRENNITIKFDRTTYNSQIIDWEAGAYYGSFFAGSYEDTLQVSSSNIQLQSVNPNIGSILASAQGATFEIVDVTNTNQVEWSSTVRYVSGTNSTNNSISLIPQGSTQPNASGTTIGFYVGMPIQFIGAAVGNLVNAQVYYVYSVINETDFTVSATLNGPVLSLTTATVSAAGLQCFTAQVINTAVLTVNYQGILNVTNTTSDTNYITVPTSVIGTGGTSGFYPGLPVFFSENVIGGIVENQVYYVNVVVDQQTFTISPYDTQLTVTATATTATSNIITTSINVGFNLNDPIIFTGTTFGGIAAGVTYYVSQLINETEMTISATLNGPVLSLTTATGSMVATNQSDSPLLTTAAAPSNAPMIMNVSLPVSPGQVNGQEFTLYGTSGQYPNINQLTIGNLVERQVDATVSGVNIIALDINSDGTNTFYVNMPIRFTTSIGGLSTSTTYYVLTYSGMSNVTNIQVSVSQTLGSDYGNVLTCNTTSYLYVGMPIVFSGQSLGGLNIGNTYYVKSIVNSTQFTVSATNGGSVVSLTAQTGAMVGTGTPYITISTSMGGSPVTLSSDTSGSTLSQYITSEPTIDISYILGGYRAIVTGSGSGLALDNTISISGALVGGITPLNDISLVVNGINSTGGITNVICSGNVPYASEKYYLKVISPTQLEVYSDPLLSTPVSGIDFPFVGFTTDTVTSVSTSNNSLTISDTSQFNINDAVVFTGNTDTSATTIVEYQSYYVVAILNGTQLQVSTTPGGTAITVASSASTNFTIAKAGSFAFLPEPFFFNQSIVKFNGRVYVCVVSNNDKTFVLGKWQVLDSNDPRLNAMDRVIGYYQPTVNMPGVDLTQLFDGVTYPNATYQGNAFQPSLQYPLDTVLQDQPFYPSNINITSIIYNNGYYFATANLPTYSAVIYSTDGTNWLITKLLNTDVNVTYIAYANGNYIITSENSTTPLFVSPDGFEWTTNGNPDNTSYNLPVVTSVNIALQSVEYSNGVWIAVGDAIITSQNALSWTEVHTYNPTFNVELYGITYVNSQYFTGYVAVGSGLTYSYAGPVSQLVPTSIVSYSADGINWVDANLTNPYFTGITTTPVPITENGWNSVAVNNSTGHIVAVGKNGVIYTSLNGSNWLGLNEVSAISTNTYTNVVNVTNTSGFTVGQSVVFNNSFSPIVAGTHYTIASIVSTTAVTLTGVTLTNASIPAYTVMSVASNTPTLNNVVYENSIWLAVGNSGTIITSSNGVNWTKQYSGVTENLHGITYANSKWTVTGDNNVVLTSSNCINWTYTSVFTPVPPTYDIHGETFQYGYGPEELVPGVISDNFAMTVVTRPGINWPIEQYGHNGYNVVSTQVVPQSATQTTYSFAGIVHYPAQVFVQKIDATTNLGTTLNNGIDYTINWLNKTIILANPLPFTPLLDTLRLDIYEVGNGNQLVKSNTNTDPIRIDPVTGFNEIYVDCNYSAAIYNGSGVVIPGSYDINVQAVQTTSSYNSIVCVSVANITVNAPITFEGITFGNITGGTTYYVKSISRSTNSITVSTSINPVTGQAGSIFELTDATGSMYIILQAGLGSAWATPIVYHNGTKLLFGGTNIVTNTTSGTNAITTSSTYGLTVGTPITFSQDISSWSPDIVPLQRYYVLTVLGANKFTISATPNGTVIPLTTQQGGSMFVTYDYAFGIQPDGISAMIIFTTGSYSNNTDYLVYSLFGQTEPQQIGYSIPETQMFTGTGSTTVFNLSNNVQGLVNPASAVVEVNGLRLVPSAYTITAANNTITFNSAPALNAPITVTTYNDTTQQYLNTQTITASASTAVVAISNISNTITAPLATATVTATASGTNYITTGSTSGFFVSQPVFFEGTSFGGISTSGTVYFIQSIVNSTTFKISATQSGPVLTLTTGTGNMIATVGGQPAVRVTTSTTNNFTTGEIIRIDGTLGSTQLNGNYYYVRVISSTQFDLYTQAYSSALNAVNYPVTAISSYTGGGYTWAQGSYYLVDTTASATSSVNNSITVSSTAMLDVNTPVIFTQPGSLDGTNILGGLIQGTVYYINEIIDNTRFNVSSSQYGTVVALSTASGTINVTQWEQTNVDRLWVTVNGYRVPSSSLRMNSSNELSILTSVLSGDTVVITNMIPTATPNEEVYINFVNETGEGTIYRANTGTRTWLTQPLYQGSDLIYVQDVTAVTNNVVQTSTVPPAAPNEFGSNVYSIGINNVDKNIITDVTVYDNTTEKYIPTSSYQIVIVDLAPVLQIATGSYVSVGDSLTITTLVGNTVYINGEQIKFSFVNFTNNTLGGLQRGANGTGVHLYIPEYTEVLSLTSNNELSNVYYNQTWNSYVYNTTLGDPLQISNTIPATFLEVDVS